jgi:DNA polymerase
MTAAWKKLQKECAAFFRQIYVGEDRVLVFGEGNPSPKLLLVGEAPGEQEALEGRPFVGKAGLQLNSFIEMLDFSREEIYITNAVKFRPTRISTAGHAVNRTPTAEEIALWRPWLLREISLLKPHIIATLGNIALRAVTGRVIAIGEVHGTCIPDTNPPVFALYHPASILYRRALSETYQEDVRRLQLLLQKM